MAVPTYDELRKRVDEKVWMDAKYARKIADRLEALPAIETCGDYSVVELYNNEDSYSMGWAIINGDIDEWIYVPMEAEDTVSE